MWPYSRNPRNQTSISSNELLDPADRVQVVDGVLHINDKPVKREKVDSFRNPTPPADGASQTAISKRCRTVGSIIFWKFRMTGPWWTTPRFISCPKTLFHDGRQPRQLEVRFGDVGFVQGKLGRTRGNVVFHRRRPPEDLKMAHDGSFGRLFDELNRPGLKRLWVTSSDRTTRPRARSFFQRQRGH